MKLIGRMILFIMVAGLSMYPAIIGCDDGKKNSNTLMSMLLLLNSYTPDKIYIYDGGTNDGYLGNRASADSLCQTAAGGFAALSGKSVKKAFISFSSTDQIKDLVVPTYRTLPVYGLKSNGTYTLLKDTWNNLWNLTGINAKLGDATGITFNWWSGSDASGNFTSSNQTCLQWTCNASPCSTPADGRGGNYDLSNNPDWISLWAGGCTDNSWHIMCVAY